MSAARYRRYSAYLRERFGQPARRLSLHAGFTCPNRDGTVSRAGCVFCDPPSFSPHAGPQAPPVIRQLRDGIAQGHARGVHAFVAYFQAYTNTYAPVSVLRDVYDSIRAFPEIKGLAIGTRPDCVDRKILELIAGYAAGYDVWLEYGLQSIHDETLLRIHRGHTAEAFFQAVALTREFPDVHIGAHVILGLPGEGPEHEAATADALARLRIDGVKLHPLHAVRGTPLAEAVQTGRVALLDREAYTDRVVRFLERLRPKTVIQRLTADCPPERLVAPAWLQDRGAVLAEIERKLEERDTWQGKRVTVAA